MSVGYHINIETASLIVASTTFGALILMLKPDIRINKISIKISRQQQTFVGISALFLFLISIAFYPGLLITDSIGSYNSLYSRSIDSYYGLYWSLLLISLYSFSGSLYPFGFLQYILYVGLSVEFINKSLDDKGLFRRVCCVVLLSPVFLIYAFYQHRDSLFAIALFAYITMTNKMYDYRALTLASICCLIRPDFELAYLAGVIKYVFGLKQKPFSKKTAYLVLIISFPVVLSTAIRETGKQFLVLDESRSPYLNTLLLQPLCGIVADKRVFETFDVTKKKDIDKAYTIASLQQDCAIPNIWIEWTESNKFSNLNYSDKKSFYSSSYEAIYSNIPAVIGRLVQIYLNAIGIGPEMEGVMDVLDGRCELCPEKFKNMNLQEHRFTYLHELIMNYFRIIESGKFRLNLILFNSIIPLLLLLFIHSWGENIRTDALITMVIIRYITILAAPSTQYAYHFPTHLAAFLLLFTAIRNRTQTACG